MKYLQFTTYYEKIIDSVLNNHSEKINSTKEARSVIKDSFLESHRWPYYLNDEEYEINNIFVNSTYFQKLWAKENNISLKFNNNWKQYIAIEQIKMLRPDVVFVTSESFFDTKFLKFIKNEFQFIKKIILWQGVFPTNSEDYKKFSYIDEVFTSSNDIRLHLHKEIKCSQIYYAFDYGLINKIQNVKKNLEVLFIGNIFLERSLHGDRADFIRHIAKNIDNMKIYTNVANYRGIQYLKNFFTKFLRISRFSDFNLIGEIKFYLDMLSLSNLSSSNNYYGIEQFKKINESLIVINKHINNIKYPANIRLFEATGLGSCLVTDHLTNLQSLFEIDKEIISYKNKFELVEKINYLNNNYDLAIEIGKNAQKKIFNYHTFSHRIEEFKFILNKDL